MPALTEPWIPTTVPTVAAKWLSDGHVEVRAEPARGVTLASADAHKAQMPQLAAIQASSSASAQASVDQGIESALILGSSQVRGMVGWLYEIESVSSGSSVVSGWLLHGQVETISAQSIHGAASAYADARVERFQPIDGAPAGDDWGSGEQLPPGRELEDGPVRRRFSPQSVGRASSRPAWSGR